MEKEREIPPIEDLELIIEHEGTNSERWEWCIKGTHMLHHPTQPAMQWKDGDWVWFWMNQEHRWDGPSSFVEGRYEYWIHGEPLNRDQWLRHPLRVEWLRTKKLGGI